MSKIIQIFIITLFSVSSLDSYAKKIETQHGLYYKEGGSKIIDELICKQIDAKMIAKVCSCRLTEKQSCGRLNEILCSKFEINNIETIQRFIFHKNQGECDQALGKFRECLSSSDTTDNQAEKYLRCFNRIGGISGPDGYESFLEISTTSGGEPTSLSDSRCATQNLWIPPMIGPLVNNAYKEACECKECTPQFGPDKKYVICQKRHVKPELGIDSQVIKIFFKNAKECRNSNNEFGKKCSEISGDSLKKCIEDFTKSLEVN